MENQRKPLTEMQFMASDAAKISQRKSNDGIISILEEINFAAHEGKRKLAVQRSLSPTTVSALINKGFRVERLDHVAIMRENLHYLIYW